PVNVPGLRESVRLRRDQSDVPHIFAFNDHDALFMLGYVHAQDRFFQMDVLRRTFSGTLAEILGPGALPQDVELRTLGLRRGAQASEAAISDGAREWLEAYSKGVNAWLAEGALPPEYAALELTAASIPAWTVLDVLTLSKGLAFGLSFDLSELENTEALLTFQAIGAQAGFDGTALFSEDLYRTAPFDPAISIPQAAPDALDVPMPRLGADSGYLGDRTLGLIRSYRDRMEATPTLRRTLERKDSPVGSNWWVADGSVTDNGYPLIANDPHLALDTPATFYEAQFRVRRNGDTPFNVVGVSFPGTAGIIQGCNPWICWGSTVHPMDVTDVYQESLVVDPSTGLPTHTRFRGELEPVVLIPQAYAVNQIGDQVADNLADSGLGPLDGGLTIVVPRRNNGPIVNIDATDPTDVRGLSVQYTGLSASLEADFIRDIARARSIADFRDALQNFDVGSQNWAIADVSGDIAYYTSAELPLREDLQTLNMPDGGVPPWIIRDGTGALMHEWMPLGDPEPDQALGYAILPFDEMPQLVNPAAGYIVNCNNDPVGTSLDNNALNQVRPGGGLYYLNAGYATGFRQGRAVRLFDAAVGGGTPLTVGDFEAFQANNQLLDAEVLVPYLTAALANAQGSAVPALAALALDTEIVEAVGRLATWDYSTPTGIPEGWDPGAPAGDPTVPDAEAAASVAATLYAAWRGQAVQSVIDDTLAAFGAEGLAPGSSLSMSALRNLLDSFDTQQGAGASGVPFLLVPGVDDPAAGRDLKLLGALRAALDLLASDTFAPAFAGSTNQDDYRWGKLHRITFDHPTGDPMLSIPMGGGLGDLAPDLPGIPRAGGLGALDASAHSARADGLNEFRFGSGPARRFVGEMLPFPVGPNMRQVIPGGQSGVPGSPYQSDQLLLWLANDYKTLTWRPPEVIGASRTFQEFFPATDN
ncbi:MAG: penicillin acylase family protein, partial [Acidobacteriota bacterium]